MEVLVVAVAAVAQRELAEGACECVSSAASAGSVARQ